MTREEWIEKLVSEFKCSADKMLSQPGPLSLDEASSQVLEMMQEHLGRIEAARVDLATQHRRGAAVEKGPDGRAGARPFPEEEAG